MLAALISKYAFSGMKLTKRWNIIVSSEAKTSLHNSSVLVLTCSMQVLDCIAYSNSRSRNFSDLRTENFLAYLLDLQKRREILLWIATLSLHNSVLLITRGYASSSPLSSYVLLTLTKSNNAMSDNISNINHLALSILYPQ